MAHDSDAAPYADNTAGRSGFQSTASSRSDFLLKGLLKLCVAAACLVGAIAAYRLLVHPLIESAFSLGEDASSIVRRANIFAAVVFSYWAFIRYYERRKS